MSFRLAVAVPKSYRFEEFRDAGRMRRSPEPAGSPFLNRSIYGTCHESTEPLAPFNFATAYRPHPSKVHHWYRWIEHPQSRSKSIQ